MFKCMVYRECTIYAGAADGHFVFSPCKLGLVGTPSNIDKYAIKNLYTKNGAFICSVTKILLSYPTIFEV